MQFQNILFSDWYLVQEKAECTGTEAFQGKKRSLEECANSCRGTSELFIYGTTDFGIDRTCSSTGCNCFCELPSGGECTQKKHGGFRLYEFGSVNEGKNKRFGIKRVVPFSDAKTATILNTFILMIRDLRSKPMWTQCNLRQYGRWKRRLQMSKWYEWQSMGQMRLAFNLFQCNYKRILY